MITDNSLQNTILNLLALRIYKFIEGLYDIIGHFFQNFWVSLFFFNILV